MRLSRQEAPFQTGTLNSDQLKVLRNEEEQQRRLVLEVYDDGNLTDTFMGRLTIPVVQLLRISHPVVIREPLQDVAQGGELEIEVVCFAQSKCDINLHLL